MNVMAVTREFLQKNPDTVERVIKAYIEAVGAMNHDKEATLKVLAKYFKRSDAEFSRRNLCSRHQVHRKDTTGRYPKCGYGLGVRTRQRRRC